MLAERISPSGIYLAPESGGSPSVVERSLVAEGKSAERIIQRPGPAIIVITPKYEARLEFRTLSGSQKSGDVRYDGLGNIYLPTYMPLSITEVLDPDGKVKRKYRDASGEEIEIVLRRFIHNPNNREFKIIFPPGRKPDLNDLSEGKLVKEEIIAEVKGGIEVAIAQQEKILNDLGHGAEVGEEVRLARDVIEYTEASVLRFLEARRLSMTDLTELADEIGVFLAGAGLYDPRDKNKKEALYYLVRAAKPDRNGRPNFLVAIERLMATHRRMADRLVRINTMGTKFERNLQELHKRRSLYRWHFKVAAFETEYVLSILALASQRQVSMEERHAISDKFSFIAKAHLAGPVVNPYLKAARWAAINLRGCAENKKEANRLILGEEAGDIIDGPSAANLVEMGKFTEAFERGMLSVERLTQINKEYADIQNLPETAKPRRRKKGLEKRV